MAGRYCVRYKHTSGGRRCAAYAGGNFGGYGDWADLGLGGYGDIALNADAGLAPVAGGGPALLTATLLRLYAKDGSFWAKHPGLVGAGAGVVTSVLYGLARGWGSAVVGGATAVLAGGAVEAVDMAFGYRVKKAMAAAAAAVQAATTPTPPAAGPTGLGYIRARQLRGFGRVAAFLPAVGTSTLPVDLRSSVGASVY